MKEKKLFLFDMDGTLIDWRLGIMQPTAQIFDVFQQLRDRGHLVMIASGRLEPLITRPLKDFKFDGYILGDGAHIVLNQQELVSASLAQEDVAKVIKLSKLHSLEYGLLFKNSAYLQIDGIIAPFLKKANFDMEKVSFDDDNDQVFKIYIHCPKERQDKIVKHLNSFNLAFEDDYNLIEIRNKHYSKASGLKAVLNELAVKTENTYFFGDGFNDVEIFNMVGHPFVMGNANSQLYQYGTVCKSVEEDGVYLKLIELLTKKDL